MEVVGISHPPATCCHSVSTCSVPRGRSAQADRLLLWQRTPARNWVRERSVKFRRCLQSSSRSDIKGSTAAVGVEKWIKEMRDERFQHLEKQALDVLRKTLGVYGSPAFPCALIAGDVVLLDLLDRLEALRSERVKVIFIDTFHLFMETHTFLQEMQTRYGFKAYVFHAAGVENKDQFIEKFGSDLFIRDIDEYDRICKVEPFDRALSTLKVDAMINGRRRDHGGERADLEGFEGGNITKVQPLVYWEFRDCWDYIMKYGIPYHPLHDHGYPSIGDIQTTVPVPKEKWFEYGGERYGRFQGLSNKDGSAKTECGIHMKGLHS